MVTYSSDLFLDIFCVCNQSSDAVGLIFHAKLTLSFISTYREWKKVVGAARFSFHICQYIKEMIMLHDSLLFQKYCLDIINELMSYFSYGK